MSPTEIYIATVIRGLFGEETSSISIKLKKLSHQQLRCFLLDEVVVVDNDGNCMFHLPSTNGSYPSVPAYDKSKEVHVDLVSDTEIKPTLM